MSTAAAARRQSSTRRFDTFRSVTAKTDQFIIATSKSWHFYLRTITPLARPGRPPVLASDHGESDMETTQLVPLYDDKHSWCATIGSPLFVSDQAMRFYVFGERKRALMEAGLVFTVRKRLVTDAPQALFNAIVAMKKSESRLRARTPSDAAVVEPIKPRAVQERATKEAEATDARAR
ncbi:hypothetical protein F0160_21045 [Paraburkholderia sp. JPY303]|uniref:hypothetical protein n=1 Tax=Paraburkholderia atlantica TaxID=2654982 RepID=UPI001590B3E4|nr:hypothetical protein [Paraburkholderia atlantica]NUY32976.1 hypothetical protein [Paraburkholderia atlantica]